MTSTTWPEEKVDLSIDRVLKGNSTGVSTIVVRLKGLLLLGLVFEVIWRIVPICPNGKLAMTGESVVNMFHFEGTS